MAIARLKAFAQRHPFLTYATYLTLAVLIGLELALRLIVDFNPSYYMGYQEQRPGAVINYPYGVIRFNQDGFPDDEFEVQKKRPRVAYIGDSVCYGVGAGQGYRVSDILEREYPAFEHMNMSFGVGAGISEKSTQRILNWQERYGIDLFVYLMNLNDILPDQKEQAPKNILGWRKAFDWLRGRSYLYTYVRLIIKNVYIRRGFEVTNQRMYEMFPSASQAVIDATCVRIRALDKELKKRGSRLVVVILPYEMQVSEDASRTYRAAGVSWADEFIARGTQSALLERLNGVPVFDAYEAFVSPDLNTDRETYTVGECFVYNKGDKLDWNHPNRKGHRLIAEFLERRQIFSDLASGRPLLRETTSSDDGWRDKL